MILETKDRDRLRVVVPDELAARETSGAPSGYNISVCMGCGQVEAGYSAATTPRMCPVCVGRVREGKALVSPMELWEEIVAEQEGQPAPETAVAHLRGLCGSCSEPVQPDDRDVRSVGNAMMCGPCVAELRAASRG